MIALDSFEPVPEAYRGAFLSIGNFDGVHQGHRQLIQQLRARAEATGIPAIALTFDPQPVAILRPEKAPVPLTWTDRKAALLKAAGATEVGVFQTGLWLLHLTAREFFETVILGQFQARGLVEGPTFGFGRDRAGNVETLADWCTEAGLAFEVAPPVEFEGQIVSSSRIRSALAEGQTEAAARLLGRPHRVRGTVIRGAGRGRDLGFPTANLDGIDTQIPANGVYAALTTLDGESAPRPSAVHIGPNATFGETVRSVEVHLIDFEGDLYDRRLEVDFLALLRSSQTFPGVEALKDQMHLDVDRARELASLGGLRSAR